MYLQTPGRQPGIGTELVQRISGMGCADCGCNGLGYFDSGADFTGWGLLEWGTVMVGGYMVMSTVFTTKRAASRVAAMPGESRKRRAAKYRRYAKELSY